MKETDLFEPVKNLLISRLHCTEVYGEVRNFDVLGIINNANVIVEMKMHLNFKVIEQAINAKRYAHYVYIAVPEPKRQSSQHHFIYNEILKKHGIGVIYVSENNLSEELFERHRRASLAGLDNGYFNRYIGKGITYSKYTAHIPYGWLAKYNNLPVRLMKADKKHYEKYINIRNDIKHFSHLNIGGAKTGSGETITDYSYMIDKIYQYLKHNGWMYVGDIARDVPTHYSNPKSSISATLREKWNTEKFVWKKERNRVYFNIKED